MGYAQCTQQEDTTESDSRPDVQVQPPDHHHRHNQNGEIDKEVGDSIPSVESILINAVASFYLFIPIKPNRSALKDCDKSVGHKVAEHQQPHNSQYRPKPTNNTEETVI